MPYADPAAQRAYQRRWARERRKAFFADKACEWCGATEQLELHHRDTSKKESHKIWSWGEARRLAEIAKCIVLCNTCHKHAHFETRRVEAELRNPCGTVAAYKRGCKCGPCTLANRERVREQAARKRAA